MMLLERLKEIKAECYAEQLRVTLDDGTVFVGRLGDYTDAGDNEEGVASISINVEKDAPEYCLFEDEIKSIEPA